MVHAVTDSDLNRIGVVSDLRPSTAVGPTRLPDIHINRAVSVHFIQGHQTGGHADDTGVVLELEPGFVPDILVEDAGRGQLNNE